MHILKNMQRNLMESAIKNTGNYLVKNWGEQSQTVRAFLSTHFLTNDIDRKAKDQILIR